MDNNKIKKRKKIKIPNKVQEFFWTYLENLFPILYLITAIGVFVYGAYGIAKLIMVGNPMHLILAIFIGIGVKTFKDIME